MASASAEFDWNPLILSLMAGLSTCLGASVVFFARRRSPKNDSRPPIGRHHLSFSLAFAGSVMITVSFFSLLPESFADETSPGAFLMLSPASRLFWERLASFAAGCGLYLVLAKCAFPEPDAILGFQDEESNAELIPLTEVAKDAFTTKLRAQQSVIKRQGSVVQEKQSSGMSDLARPIMVDRTDTASDIESPCTSMDEKPSSAEACAACQWTRFSSGADLENAEARRSWRVAMLLFVSLAVHNFPEGFAVAASSIHSPKLGITTALAIALHNIPEGIAIAVPCLAARPDSPWLAFWLASLSGLAEPLGAAVALLFLRLLRGDASATGNSSSITTKGVLSFVAGVMVMVASNELIPEALRHGKEGTGPLKAGILAGALIMIASDAVLDATYESVHV